MKNSLFSAKLQTSQKNSLQEKAKIHDASNSSGSNSNETGNLDLIAKNSNITLNEEFFANQSNVLNPKLNPLLVNKQDNVDKIITYEEEKKRLIIDSGEALAEAETSNASASPFKLPLLTGNNSSTLSRDGFVTNQRYQTLKDNKRNESQVTTCYDEVYEADQNDDEDDESTNLDSKSLLSSHSSSDSESIDHDIAISLDEKGNTNKPVIINMISSSGEADDDFDDDDEDSQDYNEEFVEKMKKDSDIAISTASSKNKFENLLRQREAEDRTDDNKTQENLCGKSSTVGFNTLSDASILQNKDLCNSVFSINKYEEEQRLLKEYENECKYGHDFDKKRHLGIQVRSENAQNLIKSLQKNNGRTSPSVSATTPLFSDSVQPDASGFLLDQLLDQLKHKNNKDSISNTNKLNESFLSKESKHPSKYSYSIQFNNYATSIDEFNNFGLKSEWNKNLNFDVNDSKTSSSYNSACCSENTILLSTNSSETTKTVPNLSHPYQQNNQRLSQENNIDSHGSSLTSSSKQDDEDDDQDIQQPSSLSEKMPVQESCGSINTTVNLHNFKVKPKPSSLTSNQYLVIDQKSNDQAMATTSTATTYTCYASPQSSESLGTNELKNTIDELSVKMTTETAKLNNFQATVAANKIKSSSIFTNASTSIPDGNHSNHNSVSHSNNGLFHQKYLNCTYDPQHESVRATKNISTNICLPSLKGQTNVRSDQSETASTHINTFKTTLACASKNKSRRNKKLNKISSNERPNDGSNNDAYSVYSSHYNEDVDKLLQFITSSSANPSSSSTSSNSKNKSNSGPDSNNSVKEQNKYLQNNKKSAQNNSASQNFSGNKINCVKTKQNNQEPLSNQQQLPTSAVKQDSKPTVLNSAPKSPNSAQNQSLFEPKSVQNQEKPIKKTIECNQNSANENFNEFDIDIHNVETVDEFEKIMEASSLKSSNDEFVTVIKGRKVKSNKKSIAAKTSESTATYSLNKTDSYPNKKSNIALSSKNQPIFNRSNLVPFNTAKTSNHSASHQNSHANKKPVKYSGAHMKVGTVFKIESTTKEPSEKSEIISSDLDHSFPPLVPTMNTNQFIPENQPAPILDCANAKTADELLSNQSTIQSNEIKKIDREEFKLEPVSNELNCLGSGENSHHEQVVSEQVARKNKYEYFKNLINSTSQSVVFLDEIRYKKFQNQLRKPQSITVEDQNENQDEKINKPDEVSEENIKKIESALADIKFGFMDSSSEFEDLALDNAHSPANTLPQFHDDSKVVEITFMSPTSSDRFGQSVQQIEPVGMTSEKVSSIQSSDDDDEPFSDQDSSIQSAKIQLASQKPKQYRYLKTKSNKSNPSKSSSHRKTSTSAGIKSTVSSSSSAKSGRHNDLKDDVGLSRTRRSSISTTSSSSSRNNSPPQNKYRGKPTKTRMVNRTRKQPKNGDNSVNLQLVGDVPNPENSMNMTNTAAPMFQSPSNAIYYSTNPHHPQQYYYYHPNGNITTYLATPNPAYFGQPLGGPSTTGIFPVPISAVPLQMPLTPFSTGAISGGPPPTCIAGYFAPTAPQSLASPSNEHPLNNEDNKSAGNPENAINVNVEEQSQTSRVVDINESKLTSQTTPMVTPAKSNDNSAIDLNQPVSSNDSEFVHNYQIPPYAAPVLPSSYLAAMAAAAANAAVGKSTIYAPTTIPTAYPYLIPTPSINSVDSMSMTEPNILTMQMPFPSSQFEPHQVPMVTYMSNQNPYNNSTSTSSSVYNANQVLASGHTFDPLSNESNNMPISNGSNPGKYLRYNKSAKSNHQNESHQNVMNQSNLVDQPTSNVPIFYQTALNFYPSPYQQSYQFHGVPPPAYSNSSANQPLHFYAPNSSAILSNATSASTTPLHSQTETTSTLLYPPNPTL